MAHAKHDEAKGRPKEGAGDQPDDDLERGGQIDQTTGMVEQDNDHAAETVTDGAHRD
jgi:uncharacterized protein YjbJ (UPF0337 family)